MGAATAPFTFREPAAVCRPRLRVKVWPAAIVTAAPVVTLVNAAGPETATVVPLNRVTPLNAAPPVRLNAPVLLLTANPPLTASPLSPSVIPPGTSRVPPLRVNVRVAVVEAV